ncbi:MAG: acetyl-CoA C-acyltransferase, partial [Gammaproteobacteria bacterium]|nr:acetyl-CoA C-acyltransferase [Gammaproteobacteria bacterium]
MTKQIQDAYIVGAVRTPVGKAPRGVLSATRPDDMLAHVLRGLMEKFPELPSAEIEDVIVGCAMPEAEQGYNVARIGVLLAGLPESVPGVTVNRFCASGLQAVAQAADRIRLGEADIMIAAGTESMSLIPSGGNKLAFNPRIFSDENVAIAYGMGITAEKVAERWQVPRDQQDAFALRSHERALGALESGAFANEVLPYTVTRKTPNMDTGQADASLHEVTQDEGPRADSSAEALAKLRSVFAARGTVTAGNSSQTSDGAAAVLLASEQAVKTHGLQPLARFVGYAVAGVAPEVMGIGPVAAIPKMLQQTGLKQQQLDWIELNEAFAAQSLAVIKELGLDEAKVNPCGGAIALGHPLGATGAVRTTTLVHGMQRSDARYGMVT